MMMSDLPLAIVLVVKISLTTSDEMVMSLSESVLGHVFSNMEMILPAMIPVIQYLTMLIKKTANNSVLMRKLHVKHHVCVDLLDRAIPSNQPKRSMICLKLGDV